TQVDSYVYSNDNVSEMRPGIRVGDAGERLPVFLALPLVLVNAPPRSRRLLRVLLLWRCALPTGASRLHLKSG
ncbi:MAG: hypothetical protein KJO98_07630, partial [Rhodothermia bacterium]|nr:hypothetical protein [Rhodothermia bacterium]